MARSLTPLDILHADFKRSVGGYDRNEVRAFLERVSSEVEESLREAQSLSHELAAAQGRARELLESEAELKRAVVAAERIATEIKESAQNEARVLLEDAERKQAAIARSANDALKRAHAELAQLRHERTLFKEQFRGLLTAYLNGLDADDEAVKVLLGDAD